jgi:hypothetical protein
VCGFSIDHLTGKVTSQLQTNKWKKHSELLHSSNVSLFKKRWNASFTHNGIANVGELVRFTISYGERTTVKTRMHDTKLIFAYIPEIVGSGTSIFTPGLVPCSGMCLLSPGSIDYGHPYPVLDEWVKHTFVYRRASNCRYCNQPTSFGEVICVNCYSSRGGDWRNFI